MDKLKAMQIFREVAHSGSFSGASDKLELAASAVSRYVGNLEDWLDVTLFQRTTRKVNLTDAGQVYLLKVEDILTNVKELELMAEDLQETPTGTLRITAPVDYSRYYVESFIDDFLGRYPGVNVSLFIIDRVVNLIEEGLDLAIRIGPLGDINLIAKNLGKMRLKLVASAEYLSKNSPIEKPQDLAEHNCLLNAVVGYHQEWKFKVDKDSIRVPALGNIIVNNGDIIADLAKRGMGVAYLPDIYLDRAIADGELVWLLPETSLEPVPISALYPADRHMSRTLQVFVRELQDHMNK